MDPGFFFSMLFIFIGAIVLVRSITEVVKRRIDFRERQLELEFRKLEGRGGNAARSDDDLEQRLRVIERIVTSSDHRLADEIEALRRDTAGQEPQTRKLASAQKEAV